VKELTVKEKALQKLQSCECIKLTDSDVLLLLTCECGKTCNILDMYKCLYCDIYRCKACSEEHFGTTVDDWRASFLARTCQKIKRMLGVV